METSNPRTWSELPHDLLRSIFEGLSFTDFHRAKSVCSNWNSIAKQTVPQKIKSPWLMLFPDGVDGCVLYNPDEDRIYKAVRDFSGIRFLANSGNWFLVLDSRSNLSIINVFSEDLIDLPPLESLLSHSFILKRIGNEEFKWQVTNDREILVREERAEHLRGLLWVDEKTKDFVVVWFFVHLYGQFIAYYKKGDNHYSHFKLPSVWSRIRSSNDIFVLQGYFLYISLFGYYIRFIDLSKHQGFEDASRILPLGRSFASNHETNNSIVVTTSGEVLVVKHIESDKSFRLYKGDPNNGDTYYKPLVEVDSVTNEESVFPDLGITVHGIEPNSIYFTGYNNNVRNRRDLNVDICVFNYVTKTLKRFPILSNMKLKDARWFIPRF